MRITSSSAQMFRSRFAQIIALSSVIAIAACQDVIAPDKVADSKSLRLTTMASADELATLSAGMDDMTGWSLISFPDAEGKAKIDALLAGLKTHLASADVAACKQDVTDARAVLGGFTQEQQVDLGAVGVTLDVIQSALDSASQ